MLVMILLPQYCLFYALVTYKKMSITLLRSSFCRQPKNLPSKLGYWIHGFFVGVWNCFSLKKQNKLPYYVTKKKKNFNRRAQNICIVFLFSSPKMILQEKIPSKNQRYSWRRSIYIKILGSHFLTKFKIWTWLHFSIKTYG